MKKVERTFKLRLFDESATSKASALRREMKVGELWHGNGRVPISGMISYRGRVDAVITFFVDQFFTDEIFQSGDTLVLVSSQGEASVVLARREGSA